jgi:hypothetical protein
MQGWLVCTHAGKLTADRPPALPAIMSPFMVMITVIDKIFLKKAAFFS